MVERAELQAYLAVIDAARRAGRKIGICGQAPSDYPEFTRFLVRSGITSISLNPDALLRGIETVLEAERAEEPVRPQALPAEALGGGIGRGGDPGVHAGGVGGLGGPPPSLWHAG